MLLGQPGDLGVDVVVRHRDLLPPRQFVEHQRALDGLDRRLALAFPQLVPVERHLPRIHPLMGELVDELLQPPIDFPADQRLGRIALDPARQLLQQVLAQLAVLVPLRLARQPLRHERSQRVQRVVAQVLGELVVEGGQHLRLHPGHGQGVLHAGPGQGFHRVLGGEGDGERLGVPGREIRHLGVEPRRVAFRPNLDADSLEILGLHRFLAVLGELAPRHVGDDRLAVPGAASLDRLVARPARAQALDRRRHFLVRHADRRLAQLDRVERARIDGRRRGDGRGELQRLVLVDRDVLHVRRVDRLHPPLAQHLVDGARNQVLGHVLQDLRHEALADDLGRHLARPEARQLQRARVAVRDALNLFFDDLRWNLDDEGLLSNADVRVLDLHGVYRVQ